MTSPIRPIAIFAMTTMFAIAPAWLRAQPAADAGQGAVTVDPDGTTHLPTMALPFSSLASSQARKAYIDFTTHPYPTASGIEGFRRVMDEQIFNPQLMRFKALYAVAIESRVIGGVRTDVVTPKSGVAPGNKDRVLINLHGGGFVIGGGGPSGQVESIPIAGLGGFKVVSVDYRMYPESKFPAASEDVAAVYRELLKTYKAANIGIYGCSAGGILTAQAAAWFQAHGLPRPGAIGIICASAGGFAEGDSGILWPVNPTQARTAVARDKALAVTGYLEGTDPRDPLVAPVFSPEALGKFPPTLIVTSTRAAELSAAAYTDVQLTKLGVDSELHVWDGLGHGDYNKPDLPENAEVDGVIVRFFDKHLGR